MFTYISYCTICNNYEELSKELKKLKRLEIKNYHVHFFGYMNIYNLKLIKRHGFFFVDIFVDGTIEYYSYDTANMWNNVGKKIFFDSVKDESLIMIGIHEPYNGTPDYYNLVLEPIKDKGYEVNLIQNVVSCHYYIVKKPTLTKPAIKYDINIVK